MVIPGKSNICSNINLLRVFIFQLKAEQLAGKVIVIYIMYLPLDDISDCKEWRKTEILKGVYNYLRPNKGFEIVFVAVDDVDNSFGKEMLSDPLPRTNLEDHFEDVFSFMPWTAIPFSDRTSRKRMDTRFGFRKGYCSDDMFIIDSTGVVLQTNALSCFKSYGSLGYPFSSERVKFLLSEWQAIAAQPTLEKLLSSPERDYVISNNGDKVWYAHLITLCDNGKINLSISTCFICTFG